jgi:hypothetical protein
MVGKLAAAWMGKVNAVLKFEWSPIRALLVKVSEL